MDKFEKDIKQKLEEGLDDISPDISRRLQSARYAALEKAQQKPHLLSSFFPQTITAAAAIAVVSVSLYMNFSVDDTAETVLAMEAEMEMLTANENLELMEELEFIEWLVENEEYAS